MKVYFKNLDGLRFIAATMVILQHCSDYMLSAGLPNIFKKQLEGLGGYGVTLFFVLSGYLIFYLLFSERKISGTVKVRNFYIRRMLRIWPLYLGFGLVLIFGIDYVLTRMGIPIHTPVGENLFYLFTFSINLQMLFAVPNRGIIELYWSVCIEEQFYLVAPWLVKKFYHGMVCVIFTLIGLAIASKIVLHYLEVSGTLKINHHNPLYFFTLCRLDDFGIGALAAILYFKKPWFEKVSHIVTNKGIQFIVIVFTVLLVLHFIPLPSVINTYLFSTIPAILFAFIILAASTGKFIVNLERKTFKMLGKYSYGIYIFHAVVSQFILFAFTHYLPGRSILLYDFLYPVCCVIGTAVVAGLSYELYERHFLKLKNKFALIKKE